MTKTALIGENTQLRQENEHLRSQVKWLQQQLFGSGKTETISKEQLELLLSGLNEHSEHLPVKKDSDDSVKTGSSNSKSNNEKTRRYQLPEHLEVEQTVIDPQEVIANPQDYKQIDEEITEELDIIPPKFIKPRTIRRKFVSKIDKERAPIIVPALKRPIDRGIAAAGLLTYIIISKYCDHLPLYRQETIYKKRYGVIIKRKAMCEWISKIVADWLKPI